MMYLIARFIAKYFFGNKYKLSVDIVDGQKCYVIHYDITSIEKFRENSQTLLSNVGYSAHFYAFNLVPVIIIPKDDGHIDSKMLESMYWHEMGHFLAGDIKSVTKNKKYKNKIFVDQEMESRADKFSAERTGRKITPEFCTDYLIACIKAGNYSWSKYLTENDYNEIRDTVVKEICNLYPERFK